LENFDCIYRENYLKMLRIARKMTNNNEAAADIVQEIFVYCYEKIKNGHAVNNIQSWLIRAVINKSIDEIKKIKKHTRLNVLRDKETDDESFELKMNSIEIKEAIDELKPSEKKLIVLYSEGYSYKEISEIAEIKLTSVGKTLSRILQKLKLILKRMNYEMY